jgi:hypothetical protein
MTPELTDLLHQSLPEVLALRDRARRPQQHGVGLRAGADDYAGPGEIEMHLNDAVGVASVNGGLEAVDGSLCGLAEERLLEHHNNRT